MISGLGLYDAPVKKVRFTTADESGVRDAIADWDRSLKAMRVTIPPFLWLF